MHHFAKRGIALALVALASAVAFAMPPNSFLRRPAGDHNELMSQVKTDAVVMDRYQRHFGLERDDIITMFEGLRLSRLSKTGLYPVYNVPSSGELRVRAFELKVGTKVWVDASGQAVLLAVCGNPLKRAESEPVVQNEVQALIFEAPADELRQLIDTEQLALGMEAEIEEEALYAAYIQEPDQPLVTVEEGIQNEATAVPPTTPVVGQVLPPAAASGGLGFGGILAGLLGASSLFWLDDLGGGDGPPAPDPVPEPATMLALGAGVAMLAARKRNKK